MRRPLGDWARNRLLFEYSPSQLCGSNRDALLDALSFHPPLFLTVWAAQMVAYHGIGLWFQRFDHTGRLARFKTRPVEARPYLEILPRAVGNQVFLLLPAMGLAQWLGLAFSGPAHISPLMWIVSLAGMSVGHDLVQYAFHRYVMHRPELMNRLGHAVHHSTTASCSISACYMSAADFVAEIVCPYLIPLVVVGGGGADPAFHIVAVTMGAFGGLYEHSGYDFSLGLAQSTSPLARKIAPLLSSRAHAEHHARGNVSFSDGFGSSSLCDTFLRTRWDLVKAKQRQRETRATENAT